MINICYDNDVAHVGGTPHIIGAGETVNGGYCHMMHEGTVVYNIDEPNYDGSQGFKTKDETVINSVQEWFDYLKKYCV